ncbi:MAG: FAD-dependent oxidoreductase [Campylobacterota bacterium]
MNRRDAIKFSFVSGAVATTSLYAAPKQSSQTQKSKTVVKQGQKQRVIIIGGGFGGLTTAKNIKINNKDAEVVVFEPKNIFASCPYSNLWLGNVEGTNYEELTFSLLVPATKYGYEVINDSVIAIDKRSKTVSTLHNDYTYDLLVIATGIEYDYSVFGLDKIQAKVAYTNYPPSYSGGFEQLYLHQKIQNFSGGTFVITVPPGAYRCPPAPYERAALVADYFKRKKIKAKVVLIDPRPQPTTKAKGFLKAFNTLYRDYLEYLPSTTISTIDLQKKSIAYKSFDVAQRKYVAKTLYFDDANIIPANQASPLLKQSGLAVTSTGWGRVKNPGFESINDSSIYLVGDVVGEYPFPKSAQIANSSGIILGQQIAKRLKGHDPKVGSVLPGNVCYSMVSSTTAIAVTHQAYLKDGKVAVESNLYETADNGTAQATKSWYHGITGDIFAKDYS